ncbi:MAG: 30S ribosomal protein S21 [Brevinematales bacterium]|nr:30S ribosomal protein S21 [Brevinematales bacterium]
MALMVEIKDGDNIEFALKKFKKFVEMEGILSEYKAHLRYKKPSEERKEKLSALKKKLRKLQNTKEKKK